MERRRELDGLRGLAAFLVLVSHVSNRTGLWGNLLGHGGGQIGVMIFFCLSGYLMGALYLSSPFRPVAVWRYALHRFARVAPLYYLVVFVSLGLGIFLEVSPFYGVTDKNLAQHVLMVRGVSVLWTIPVEVQFYSAFVGLWALSAVTSSKVPVVLCAACIPVFWCLKYELKNVNDSLVAWAPFFLVGLLISRLKETRTPTRTMNLMWSVGFVIGVALLALLYPQVAFWLGGQEFADKVKSRAWHDPLAYVGVGWLLVAALRAPLARVLLGNSAMVFAGAISYSAYLFHVPIMNLLNRQTSLIKSPELFLLATMTATTALGALSFYLFENPARRSLNTLS
jgi:peptidoglycan/LPS O-acetylase OafA/YrhL